MKKLLVTLVMITAVITFANAQNAYSLYKMTNAGEAEKVLTILAGELKLSETEQAKLGELLHESAKGQSELFQKPENSGADFIQNIVRRQTSHIEENLEEIIGGDKFKQYLVLKPTIEKKIQQE